MSSWFPFIHLWKLDDLENLVANKDTKLSEKDEIEELKRQLEEAKKYKPTDNGVAPGESGIGGTPIPPITLPPTIPTTTVPVTTTTSAISHRGVPVYLTYPPGYPVHGYPYYPPMPYYIP